MWKTANQVRLTFPFHSQVGLRRLRHYNDFLFTSFLCIIRKLSFKNCIYFYIWKINVPFFSETPYPHVIVLFHEVFSLTTTFQVSLLNKHKPKIVPMKLRNNKSRQCRPVFSSLTHLSVLTKSLNLFRLPAPPIYHMCANLLSIDGKTQLHNNLYPHVHTIPSWPAENVFIHNFSAVYDEILIENWLSIMEMIFIIKLISPTRVLWLYLHATIENIWK